MREETFKMTVTSRTSHEVRGLKYQSEDRVFLPSESHLTRGAWIEMKVFAGEIKEANVAPHTRCVD